MFIVNELLNKRANPSGYFVKILCVSFVVLFFSTTAHKGNHKGAVGILNKSLRGLFLLTMIWQRKIKKRCVHSEKVSSTTKYTKGSQRTQRNSCYFVKFVANFFKKNQFIFWLIKFFASLHFICRQKLAKILVIISRVLDKWISSERYIIIKIIILTFLER